MGALYYGDNLDILRRYIADESIDLAYLARPALQFQAVRRGGRSDDEAKLRAALSGGAVLFTRQS